MASDGAFVVPVGGGETGLVGGEAAASATVQSQPLTLRSPAPARRPVRLHLDLAAIALGVLVALRGETHTGLVTAGLLICGYPLAALVLLDRRPPTWEDGSLLDELRHVLTSSSIAALMLIGTDAIVAGPADVALGLRIWVCTIVLLAIGRSFTHGIRRRSPLAGAYPTLIVGAGKVGAELAKRLRDEPRHGLSPVGFLDYGLTSLSAGTSPALPLLGTPDDLAEQILRTGAECVAFAFPVVDSDERLLPLLEQCERLGVRTFLVPRLFEALSWRTRVRHVGSLPLSELAAVGPSDFRFVIKDLLDRFVAGLLLFVLAPFLIAIGALVKVSSPGPALFRQRRIGRDAREFEMLKFRTMRERPDRSAVLFLPGDGLAPGGVEHEDRRTAVGMWLRRMCVDELPQLINVVRGEMSLVGPRPERPEYVRLFGAELRLYDRRHRVKSGITGLAQVSGLRGQTSIAERAEYDNFYVQNWSFWLDLKIALRTVTVILAMGGE